MVVIRLDCCGIDNTVVTTKPFLLFYCVPQDIVAADIDDTYVRFEVLIKYEIGNGGL